MFLDWPLANMAFLSVFSLYCMISPPNRHVKLKKWGSRTTSLEKASKTFKVISTSIAFVKCFCQNWMKLVWNSTMKTQNIGKLREVENTLSNIAIPSWKKLVILEYPSFSTLLWKCIVPSKFEVFYMVVTCQNMYQIFFQRRI